jgi:hypothetical protein
MLQRRKGPGGSRPGWWIATGIALVALAAWVGWTVLRSESAADTEGAIRTLVGHPAPMLQFQDAGGQTYAVPDRGRPTVLIFHMGFF